VESYGVFRPDNFRLLGDMPDAVARLTAKSFLVAVEMSGPFLVVGLMLYVTFGLIGRLLPQIQVFFITLPLQIGLGFMVFALVLSTIMRFWMESFAAALRTLGLGE
jgi:flagellar biosynthetic protein FliR